MIETVYAASGSEPVGGIAGWATDLMDRLGAGGAAFDPEVVRRPLAAHGARNDPLARLTPRERDVLDAMAQGHTNASIAGNLHISRSAVEKHVNAIFDKLDLSHAAGYSRRVLAVLRYLGSEPSTQESD